MQGRGCGSSSLYTRGGVLAFLLPLELRVSGRPNAYVRFTV